MYAIRVPNRIITSRDRPKSAPSSSFLTMQRTLFSNVYHFLSAEKTQEIRIRLWNHFYPAGNKNKNPFFGKIQFFMEKAHSAEKGTFSSKNYLFSSRNQLYSGRVPFDQMKISGKNAKSRKSLNKV